MIGASPRRLPIETVVRRSFLFAWESRATLRAPYVIYAVVTIVADLLVNQTLGSQDRIATYLLTAVEQVFAMAFAVGVHRFVLLAQAPPGFRFFRWDRHFVRYVLVALLLLVLALSAALMVFGALSADTGVPASGFDGATAFLGLIVMVLLALVVSRFALILPAAALGDPVQARQIWRATEGNGFRLLATGLVTALPFLVAEAALVNLMPESGGGIAAVLVAVAIGLISPIQLIVITIMLSLSYDVLIRGGGPPARYS